MKATKDNAKDSASHEQQTLQRTNGERQQQCGSHEQHVVFDEVGVPAVLGHLQQQPEVITAILSCNSPHLLHGLCRQQLTLSRTYSAVRRSLIEPAMCGRRVRSCRFCRIAS